MNIVIECQNSDPNVKFNGLKPNFEIQGGELVVNQTNLIIDNFLFVKLPHGNKKRKKYGLNTFFD